MKAASRFDLAVQAVMDGTLGIGDGPRKRRAGTGAVRRKRVKVEITEADARDLVILAGLTATPEDREALDYFAALGHDPGPVVVDWLTRAECPECDDDDAPSGDANRDKARQVTITNAPPINPAWSALSGGERVAVMRWLKRGDAAALLLALGNAPANGTLRGLVLDGLNGGPVIGWKLYLPGGPRGGPPRKSDRQAVESLRNLLVSGGCDLLDLATELAVKLAGSRSRSGWIVDPMGIAMIGILVEMRRLRGESYEQATYKVAASLAEREPEKPGDDPHNLKNIQRLYDLFKGL